MPGSTTSVRSHTAFRGVSAAKPTLISAASVPFQQGATSTADGATEPDPL